MSQHRPTEKAIMVSGLIPTDNGNDKADDDPMTIIVVRATDADADGLYVDKDLIVTVDGAPTIKTMFKSPVEVSQGEKMDFIQDVVGFFEDVESDLEISDLVETSNGDFNGTDAKSSDSNIATASIDGGHLDLVAKNAGTATITVRATEASDGDGLGQWVEQSFTVVVKAKS